MGFQYLPNYQVSIFMILLLLYTTLSNMKIFYCVNYHKTANINIVYIYHHTIMLPAQYKS